MNRPSKILVVDDEPFNVDYLEQELEELGYETCTATNGQGAIQQVTAESPDAILLDIMMPVMDGFTVLGYLKADKNTRDIPVIIISAMNDLQSVVKGIEMGAEDYLPKPVDPILLRARLSVSLEKKRLRDQETEYLRQVEKLTEAATAVENNSFEPDTLTLITTRADALGNLARVFVHMAREVYTREQSLKQQVQELRIELNQTRQQKQIAEITESDYFQQLQTKAQALRRIVDGLSDT